MFCHPVIIGWSHFEGINILEFLGTVTKNMSGAFIYVHGIYHLFDANIVIVFTIIT